jgi:hypothetical protein
MKVRVAWGRSGRAPGAFDAVRTWEPVGWGGQPAFFPRNVGNPDLGPERTTEVELGFDGAFFGDRLTSQFTWYSRDVDAALFSARQIPSLGFLNSQQENVGSMTSKGVEATVNYTVLRNPTLEWQVGASLFTTSDKVTSLGGAADFSIGNFGWIMKDQAIPVIRTDFCVTNPEELGATPEISTDPNDCIFGPNLPTKTYGINTNLLLPKGFNLIVRGEYQGGHYMYDGAAFNAVTRSVRWPGCYQFYSLQEAGRTADIRPIDQARCTPASSRADYFIYPANFFKLREISLNMPVPARYFPGASNASFTLAGHNVWRWLNDDFPVFDPETGNNGGFDSRVRSILEHVPPPASYTATLRIVF